MFQYNNWLGGSSVVLKCLCQWWTHSSTITGIAAPHTVHGVFIQDAVDFLKALPDPSVQLILIDPPYNLDLLDNRDSFHNYLDWGKRLVGSNFFNLFSQDSGCKSDAKLLCPEHHAKFQ